MSEKILHLEITIDASVSEVWKRWTTSAGIKSFFAPGCNVDIKPGGPYEIFFYPDNPPGQRGADSQMVLAVEDQRMLTFTWNFPPDLADIRDQRTLVIIRFEQQGKQTLLTLDQCGWGTSDSWTRGFDYFNRAWGRVVLPRLKYSFREGPIDWTNPPTPDELLAAV
jgi:uncharacterized protein YndB with AHSA1/START domain